jgi:DNA processing protein
MDVNTLKLDDVGYPNQLTNIADPPSVIYISGTPLQEWVDKPKLAVVGSRKFTLYGKTVTEKIVSELAAAGVVIISGLAYGIDIIAHQSALAAGGLTAAVLPCGLDNIYPSSHINIARRIAKQGALISEYPPDSGIAFKSNFIARNRLISGLADAVLIPEAALKSGSLHTARFALEQGKSVMAVPGNIMNTASEGCNNLIKSGAIPVTSASDIFFALKLEPKKVAQKLFSGSETEQAVYRLIAEGVGDQEELALAADADAPTLSSALTMLEIGGHIRAAGGGTWILS